MFLANLAVIGISRTIAIPKLMKEVLTSNPKNSLVITKTATPIAIVKP